jgi:uncharacterized protein involved in outer membrane biogenesis
MLAAPLLLNLLLQFYDINRLKPRLEQIIRAQTGRDFTMQGDLRFTPGLAPTIHAESMVLGNAEWAREKNFATLGVLEITFQLYPLLKGQLVIDDMTARNAEIFLEQGKKPEQQNWRFTVVAPAEEHLSEIEKQSGFQWVPRLSTLTVEHVVVHHQPAKGTTRSIEFPRLVFALDESNAAQLDVDFVHEGIIGQLRASSGSWQNFPLSDGAVYLQLQTPKKTATLTFDGKFAASEDIPQLQGALTIKATSLAALRPWYAGAPDSGTISLRANTQLQKNRLQVSDLKLKGISEGAITGTASLNVSGKPSLVADLKIPAVIRPVSPEPASQNTETAPVGQTLETSQKVPPPSATESSMVIPDLPLPVAWMHALDAQITLAIQRFEAQGRVLKDIEATAKLSQGKLTIAPLRFHAFDGVAQAELHADATQTPPRFTLRLDGERWLLDQLIHPPANEVGRLEGGQTHLVLNINGQGESLRPVLRTLMGTARFFVSDLRYRSPAAAAALTDFFQILRGKAGGTIGVSCALGRFDIRDGIATARALGLNTTGAIVTGDGTINVADERLGLVLYPRAKTVGLSDLAVPVRFTGSFHKPKIRIDAQGTALKVGEVALGIATSATPLGWALLGKNLTDKLGVTAENDPCRDADAPAPDSGDSALPAANPSTK